VPPGAGQRGLCAIHSDNQLTCSPPSGLRPDLPPPSLLHPTPLASQVASFCRTPMAAEAVFAGLRLGTSQAESEQLLQQTEEAAAAGLPLEGDR
jgi:hypothetical protein